MASSIIIELSKRLQCAICLETVSNPKNLICNHSYCKDCLDKILKFASNGSASIRCPQGCENVTKITCKQTTNDLGVNYMLRDILEVTNREEGKGSEDATKVTCENCPRVIKNYCTHCAVFRCGYCPDEHNDTEDVFIPVDFHAGLNKVVIVCTEHATEALYMCCEGEFICVFCAHRGHKGHNHKTLVNVEVGLKDEVTKGINERNHDKVKNELKKDVLDVQTSLEKVLKTKKLKCVSEYFDYLEKEEEAIKNEFNLLSEKHSCEFGSVAYLQGCLSKEGAEFVVQRKEIMKKLKDIDAEEQIPCVTVSLTDSKFDDQHPLGSVSVAHQRGNSSNQEKSFINGITAASIHPSTISSLQSVRDMIEEELNTEVTGRKRKWPGSSALSIGKAAKVINRVGPVAGIIRLEVTNVSELNTSKRVYSDPLMIKNLSWNILFLPVMGRPIIGSKLVKYAGIYLECAPERKYSSWSCQVQVSFKLYSQKGNHITKELTHQFTEEIPARGYEFIQWDHIIDPSRGYVNNNSIEIQAFVKAEAPIFKTQM